MDFEAQIQALLAQPPPEQQELRSKELTSGLSVEVRLDAGGGKGKGVFATQVFAAGEVVLQDPPLAAIQHTANRGEAWVCGHCFRFIGSVEQQIARQIMAAREAAQADADSEAASDDGEGAEEGSSHGDDLQREAALALSDEQLEALASGELRLPGTDAVPLPRPVRCPGGCCEEWYCSSRCAEAAWEQYHQLLCVGPEAEDATQGQLTDATAAAGKGKAAAEEPSSNSRGEGGAELAARREALREFLHHADSTNDIFRLAALVVAKTLLGAQRQLDANPGAAGGSSSSSGSGGASTGREPSAEACWRALLAAWQPFAVGHKGLWWECTAAPPEATADMRQLAADSLELLCAAMPPRLLSRFPALLTLPVWGSIIGMFELNNLALFVPSPLQRWLDLLGQLPPGEQEAAYAAAGPFIEALPEELPGCEGNAFYGLHSCCNHSCAPNAEAFKRDQDDNGCAVILALRDIAPGEEVTLSYIDEEAPLEERREQLGEYGFACACDKCSAEELAAELAGGL
ncbi:hypothetical protein ABPG77_002835 [Micractinium sp. CCAP 211/92]